MPTTTKDRFNQVSKFYSRWKKKSKNINPIEIDDWFDKFITEWIVYNRLYQEAGRILVSENIQ